MKFVSFLVAIFIIINFSSAQNSADAYYDLLDNQYRQNTGKTNSAFLIKEFKEYMILFPDSKQEDELLFNLSQLYKTINDVPAQIFSLIKLRIIHPRSPLSIKAYQLIDSLVVYNNELRLTHENEKAIKEINNLTPAISHQVVYVEFLSFLHFAEIKVFDVLFIEEIRSYKLLYGTNANNLDALNYWQACAYKRKGDLNAALLYFQKVSDIFVESKFVAPSLLQMSEIYTTTNRHDKASDCLIELINQYPDARETGDAQYALAQLYHYHYKDLKEALTNYKMLAQVFPENRHFNSALINAAKISEDMGQYEDALSSYMMIVENNTITAETLKALKNILRIHLEIQKDYNKTAQDYILMTQMFPDSKDAPQNLLKAAKIYKENLKNVQKAHKVFEVLLTGYPNTAEAKEAQALMNEK